MSRRAKTKADRWPHLQALIENGGNISIGRIDPIPCAAVAADAHAMYAALQRQRGESLEDLLDRLDTALHAALTDDVYTDEINS